jgi:hypothetical protein
MINTNLVPIFGTQGGGTVKQVRNHYEFVTVPPWGDFKVGDLMPKEWGTTGPINEDELRMDAEVLYDNNVCLLCFKQHETKEEMINCECIYSNRV